MAGRVTWVLGGSVRERGDIVGAVDFGSREVRAVIVRKDEEGVIQVVGFGSAPGKGCVSQGVIQDQNAAQSAFRKAIGDAEREARIHVTNVFCGINGRNVETFIREGHVNLDQDVVEQKHMDEALDLASRDILSPGKRVVSSITAQEWYVDDLRVIDPKGINGHLLKTRIHFARIPSVIEDNIIRCVESQRRELEDVIFMPLASALGCLTPEDRELGVAVLDMGRTTTGLSVFRDQRILGTQTFEWGGYHLTRDVAAGLHVSFEEADELVLEYGISNAHINAEGVDNEHDPLCLREDEGGASIKLKTVVHGAASVVAREELDLIVYERAIELLTKVRQHLHSRGLSRHLVRGVVLTGGAASIKNHIRLAEAVFQVPCRVGIPTAVEILPSAARGPECSGIIGVARHGFEFRTASRNGRLKAAGAVVEQARRIGYVFKKYFG